MVLPSAARTESPPPLKRARPAAMDYPHSQSHSNGGYTQKHLPPLSLSILGVEPMDEFIKEIADFVHHMITVRAANIVGNVEVEAKIGVIRDKSTGRRFEMPVLVETILIPDLPDIRFESNMSANQHKHFNNLLNNLTTASNQPSHPSTPLNHTHQYLRDSFYPTDPNSSTDREKIRVTKDEATGTVLECIQKIRLGDLNIYSPKRNADWRISVSVEVSKPHPIGTATHTRRKDRLSYAHEEFTIDLTQVTSATTANAPAQISHELEVEISRPELLRASAHRRTDPNVSELERSAFDELIRAFVNNSRILVRNAIDGWQGT